MITVKKEKIKKYILRDNYFDISYRRYIKFKESKFYNEAYKKEILSQFNKFFAHEQITEESVVDIAKKIRDENPTSGSFVHWSNTADLVEFAEARPKEVSHLWNQLYDDSLPLKDRITEFREIGKAFKEGISLGAPLFGYLLAAYHYETYPLYKQEIFQEIKQNFGTEHTLEPVSDTYADFVLFCSVLLEELKKRNPQATMLDVQDFIYCSTRYEQIRVESAVEYLYEMAKSLRHYMDKPADFLHEIKQIDTEVLEKRREFYRSHEKVNKIRFQLLDKILQGQDVTIADLEEIKNDVKTEYETNILHSWTNFTILFQLYYFDKKDKVQRELQKIHQAIRQIPELESLDFVEDQTLNGFDWNNSFGTDHAWIAVYEKMYESHRSAIQYFALFKGEHIRYGLYYGSDHPNHGKEDLVEITNIHDFTYEQFKEKYIEIALQLQQASSTEIHEMIEEYAHHQSEDIYEVDIWLNMLQNESIFTASNLEYLYKMYEMGGEASASELAKELGIKHEVINGSFVHLARRIQHYTKSPFPQNSRGEDCYWCVLFTGEYKEKNDLFTWTLKDNLKEAMSIFYEKPTHPKYSKTHFLEEVFIDEALYDTMANLLDYKKNIILQGPPGVGKTFVSKRLAYSLMGEVDDSRVEMIQFHQNYAYEDFVMGYRPDGKGGFSRQYGIFYEFCKRALVNPEDEYFFIIDEINRGNLSKIFGELFMLIEKDKRDDYVTMSYSKESFTVPHNVYIIGTMNTADRSLAQLEVALRRRFSFITLEPQFNQKWENHMQQQGVSNVMIHRILDTVQTINQEIRDDFQLGRGYEIGHSFFTSTPGSVEEEQWYQNIIDYEIKPLLEEYYFDRPEKVSSLVEGI